LSALLAALVLHASCPSGLEPEARAEAACALLAQKTPAPAPDRALLNALLDEPEFSRARNKNANVAAVLLKRFWDWLKRLLETKEASAYARLTPYLVLGVAFAAALLGALRLRRRRDPKRPAGAVARGAAALTLDAPGEHLERARALLATVPRQAIREGLLALLSSLERRRLARPDRVKTNRELWAELPGRGAPEALVNAVGARLNWYDRAFYSLAEVDAAEARAFIDGVATLAIGDPR
jgi:hypothetical protein